MAKWRREAPAPEGNDEQPEPDALEGDSSFEAAQQLLQAAVAEIRAWEPSPEAVELGAVGPDEASAHRRWRRRMHTDTGEHAAISAAEAADVNGLAEAEFEDELEFEADPELEFEAEPEFEFEAESELEDQELEAEPDDVEDVLAERVAEETTEETPVAAPAPAADDEPAEEDAAPDADVGPVAVAAAAAGAGAIDAVADGAEVDGAPGSGAEGSDVETVAPEVAEPARRWRRRAGTVTVAAAGAAAAGAAGDDLTGLADTTYEQRGPRRRKQGPARPQTIAEPTAAYVLAIEHPVTGPAGEAPDPVATDSSQRGRRILVGSLAALVAVGALAIAVSTAGSDDEVASPVAKVQPRLAFAPVTTPEGVTATRVWKLDGAQGDEFTGRLRLTNPTSKAVTTTFTEVIPKSLASSVSSITFDPQPVVVKADPVVQYTETIAPGDTFVATYEIAVPATGATRQRLLKWSEDLEAERGTTTTTTLPPATTTTVPVAPPSTSPPATTPATTPATAAPATTAPPPPPPANGFIWMSVNNTGQNPATFTFSNGVTLQVPSQGLSSSGYISVPAGSHQVSLDTGTTTGIACSGTSSGSGSTANYDVAPGETVGCTWTAFT